MTLSEAYYLATVIRSSNKAELVAIGRFLPLDQLHGADHWGCSVLLPDASKVTVWTMVDWCQLVDKLLNSSAKQDLPEIHVPPTPTAARDSTRPDAKHRNQLSLF